MWGANSKRDASSTTPVNGTWVDAVTGRHITSDLDSLLAQRRLTYRKDYGWCYDVWPEQPTAYALSGAIGRFSLQATVLRVKRAMEEGVTVISKQAEEMIRQHREAQNKQ
ncbi:hypothetical protein CEUSTIGMA_g8139.t1 [Chlamydomonas eustigma]|uniref:Uncharacterized protein n=1 Tax=Chlamydomonas eustigma TaxID=1157962 RepID=A0A250XC90_9CHLO|nr:hypothetical protein CEUSTIGMA_g8139.t1 [Chlamydomonas eustigma]|eukprot:GAX80704.1 hypothetical protein CEUSTIGMA_g8139.t1 [Chlamydomonas eustigma]